MNPIELAFIAASAGCGAGVAWVFALLRLAQDALPALPVEPVDELRGGLGGDSGDLLAWLQELPAVRSEDPAEDRGEVPAQ